MKKILIGLFSFITINVMGQITLLQTYDSASSSWGNNQLMMIKFEISGERFVNINRMGEYISIYNLNHSLNKKISFSGFPGSPNTAGILYLSESLFNTDSKIEFMYCSGVGVNGQYTGIYNEDDSLIFSDTGAAMVIAHIPMQQYPIYNSSSLGTIMILSYRGGQAKVFSLPGSLSADIANANTNLLNQSSISSPYPNPTKNTTTINYTLPSGINEGEIVFYNLQGAEVKRFKVDKTFSTLLVSTADIAEGTYLYQLQTSVQSTEGKKMVVIK